jgi:hypothetical protein
LIFAITSGRSRAVLRDANRTRSIAGISRSPREELERSFLKAGCAKEMGLLADVLKADGSLHRPHAGSIRFGWTKA